MCIIIPDVNTVSNTRIFAAGIQGGRQLTVYQNQVGLDRPAAMILPYPHGNTLDLVDLSNYSDLFDV